jgi:hypothetical protein
VREGSGGEFQVVAGAGLVVDDEVVGAVHAPSARDRGGRGADVPELGDGHLQGRLVGLVAGAERVVAARVPGHLDVAAEHVGDWPALGQRDHPVEAGEELREVERVEAPRVDRVAGEQETGPRVVDRDGRSVVTGAAGDLQHPAAQVELGDLLGPAGEAEVRLYGV